MRILLAALLISVAIVYTKPARTLIKHVPVCPAVERVSPDSITDNETWRPL